MGGQRKMKRALISRFGAYGDQIHCSHIPRLLKEREGYDYVAFQYNDKGYAIHKENPFIDEHIHFEPSIIPQSENFITLIRKRLAYLGEKFDTVIDLQHTLETKTFALENQSEYYRNDKFRAKMNGIRNLYDETTIAAGFPQHVGMVGDIFFTKEEEECVKNIYRERYSGKFVIIINLSGSSRQKLFLNAEKIIKTFLEKHPEAVCITMGDEDCRKNLEFTGERIINRAGKFDGETKYSFRQSMLMSKYANLVMGYESGLMCASTLLGAPSLQLMTSAAIKSHGGDFINDYSLQSPCYCSPCFKGPYQFVGCPKIKVLGKDYPKCIQFDPEVILNKMEEVYYFERNRKPAYAN